jgi:5-methylcytosine-specific restriction endonuclease McrA
MLSSANKKPNRCKHCRERMPEEFARHVLHDDCIQPWLEAQAVKKEAARKKKERADDRVRKAKLKRLSDHQGDAQTAVNSFVRSRDHGLPCISCGTPWAPDFQAGHYRSRGAAKNLALDPRNIFGQCVQCNLHKHSNAVEYRLRLIERCGLAHVEALESDHTPRHYSADDLQAIRKQFQDKTKALRRERNDA